MSKLFGVRDAAVAPSSAVLRPSRRTFLQGSVMLGAAGLLAACGDDGEPDGSGNSNGTGSGGGGTVRVWTVPEGPSDEAFQRAQFDTFMKDNPDVKVELQFFAPDAYGNAMQLAFTGGGDDVPDVFRQSGAGELLLRQVQRKGWIQPLDEFVTDDFTSRFPEWVFADGSPLLVDGDLYGVPRPDPRVQALRPLFYNIDVLDQFGFDAPPATWSEMREIAAKISTDGNNEVYGTAGLNFLTLQRLAGPQPYGNDNDPPISLLTGEPMFSDPSFQQMVEFGRGLQADQIFTPGWESWAGTDAIQQMAAGRLGFYMFPIFHAAEIRKANPEINLGIAPTPVPDGGRAGSLRPNNAVLGFWFMSSEAKSPEAAWRVLDFFGSEEFQRAAFQEVQQISVMPSVYDGIEVDEDTQAFRALADDLVRAQPDPYNRDPEVEVFFGDVREKSPKPPIGARIAEAITTGADFGAMAADYDAQVAAVIDEVLGEGVIESMDAFAFPDWNPLEDYEG